MAEDLAHVSASKKRKIKKKAKQQAEQERIKQLEDLNKIEKQIEAAKDIKDLDFVPHEVIANLRKLRPNVSQSWLRKLRSTLCKDPIFKPLFAIEPKKKKKK